MGRHEEALQQAETARALDPLSLIIQTWVGLRYYFAGKDEAAIAEYRKALASRRPNGRWPWTVETCSRLPRSCLCPAGKENEARAVLARLARASTSRHVSAYHVAAIHIALGDTTAGLDWLERAYDEQSPWTGYLRVDPRVDPVRSHPRFKSVLRKARLAL